MAQQIIAEEIEIVREGTARERALRSTGPDSEFHTATFVRVGKFHGDHVRVVGYRSGSQVYLFDVRGPSQWEPTTTNKGGGVGAYRDMPPADEEVEAAIARARSAIVKDAE